MKQVKFFLVALMAVVMGVSVTSCMNGDDNSGPRTLSVIAKLDSYGSNFKMIDGTKLVPTDPTSIMLLNSGMYIVNGQYNVEDVNVNAASITFTLTSTPTNIDGPSVTSTPDDADATMYALNYENTYYPYFFDKNTLILPAMFHFKNSSVSTELEAELKKHKFILSYDAEKVAEGGETLDLYVNHIITEDKDETRTSYTVSYQAYDLSSVLHQFTNLKKIIVHAQVNTSSNKLDNSSTREEKFEIDYSKISQCGLSVFVGSLLTNGWGGPQSFQIAMTNCCAVAVALFGGYFLAAYAINEMGTRMFGMHSNMPLTQQFAGYALVVPFLLQIVTGLLPDFRIIAWLLQFYIVYVVWEGVPILMGVEEKQRLKYTLLSSVLLILCPAVIQIVFNRLTAILN